jgi:DNA-binding NtrC family response regulator
LHNRVGVIDRTLGARPNGRLADSSLEQLEERARLAAGAPLRLREWVALAEAWRIAQALRDARGNRTAAARALGIGRRTLYSKMERLGLVPSWSVDPGPRGAGSPPALTAQGSADSR